MEKMPVRAHRYGHLKNNRFFKIYPKNLNKDANTKKNLLPYHLYEQQALPKQYG